MTEDIFCRPIKVETDELFHFIYDSITTKSLLKEREIENFFLGTKKRLYLKEKKL